MCGQGHPMLLLRRGLIVLLTAAAVAVGAETVPLEPTEGVTTWPGASYRYRDIAENAFAPSYQDAYHYAQATVNLQYETGGVSGFQGHLSAAGLKPNFAYQMKLVGKPSGIWGAEGDDAANEALGFAGRWWRVQPNPGNADDADYLAHHDDPAYIYEGYLLFDFFLSDRWGGAEVDFALDSSFHVLWWEQQRTPQACDSPVKYRSVTGAATDAAYNFDLTPTDVGVYAEIERLCYGETVLPEMNYRCRFILTEESFHQSGGPSNPRWASRNGLHFSRDDGDFFYAGTNTYYLMVYAADLGLRHYVDEVLEETKAMSLNVMRTWAFNDGASQWNALQTSPGVYDEQVFQGLDYVVAKSGELGLQLILPFVNNWDDYGGMNQYVSWSGTASSHDHFYTDTNCRSWYQNHIAAVLGRVNTFNGLVYKDDPTIFAWELANEPRCQSDGSGDTLQEWIETMSAYVKSLDPDHMVTTGSEGFYGPTGPAHNPLGWMSSQGVDYIRNHQPASIDFGCFHAWPDHWGISYAASMDWASDHIADSETLLGKPVILEEFGKHQPFSTRDQFYQGWYDEFFTGASAGSAAGGSNFWILYHDDYPDYDSFGVYYPADASTVAIIETESRRIRDLSGPVPWEGNWASAMVCDTLDFTLETGADLPPGPVGSLEAQPGNAQITVTWTDPGDADLDGVEIWRAMWHDGGGGSVYPEYDDVPGHVVPARPGTRAAAASSSEWQLAGNLSPGAQQLVDPRPARGIFFYEAFAYDLAGQYGDAAEENAAATSYILGDVANPYGLVNLSDVTFLGASYGLQDGDAGYNADVDVGPTDDGSGQGLPLTDDSIDFDDLMIYSLNYDPGAAPRLALAASDPSPRLAWREAGEGWWILDLLDPGGGIKGLRVEGDWPLSEVSPGDLLERGGPYFLRNASRSGIDLGLAVLGTGIALREPGELLHLRLPAGCDPRDGRLHARDFLNRPMYLNLGDEDSPPAVFRVGPPHPNPFNPKCIVRVELPEGGRLRCEILDLRGRLLGVACDDRLAEGVHSIEMDLREVRGAETSSGIYLYQFHYNGQCQVGKLVLLK